MTHPRSVVPWLCCRLYSTELSTAHLTGLQHTLCICTRSEWEPRLEPCRITAELRLVPKLAPVLKVRYSNAAQNPKSMVGT